MPQIVGSADDGNHQTQNRKCLGQRKPDDGEGPRQQRDNLEDDLSAREVDGCSAEEVGKEAERKEGGDEEAGLRIGQLEVFCDERQNHEKGGEDPVGGAMPKADNPQIPLAL
jgi:hypothetical protein